MNQTLQTIATRYSCRNYTGSPVAQEALEQIAAAAMQSPSAINSQRWQVIFITNKGLIDELNADALEQLKNKADSSMYERIMSRGGVVYYNAPVMAVVLKQSEGTFSADMDCGILVQNMALAATSLGLDNVICAMGGIPFAGPQGEAFKSKINWPAGYEFAISLLIGHGTSTDTPHSIDMSKVHFVN